jgi:uncharacterized protein (TIGR02145 family)
MKNIILILGLAFCYITGVSQETGTFKDTRDGKVYKTVKIGTQVWMAENLAYKPGSGDYCIYNGDSSNLVKYGYLYDWQTAKSVCPKGWHLPSKSEFDTFLSNVGGSGSKAYLALEEGGSSGYNALLGGYRYALGVSTNIGKYGYWWSSMEKDGSNAWHLYMNSFYNTAYIYYNSKVYGLCVRCLHD